MMWAKSDESTVSISTPASNMSAPPNPRRCLEIHDGQQVGEELRQKQDAERQQQELQGPLGVMHRPDRKKREAIREVLRDAVNRLKRQREREDKEEQPEERGDVSHDAHRHMHAADPMQPARKEHPRMLEVAPRPTPVADR